MDKIHELVQKLNELKAGIDAGRLDLKKDYETVKAQVAELLTWGEGMKEKHGELISKNEELAKRVEFLEGIFSRSDRTISLPGLEHEKQKFSFLKAGYAMAVQHYGKYSKEEAWKDAGFEREVLEQTRAKATNMISDNTLGGYLVPAQVVQEIIDVLRPQSIAVQLGATVMSDLQGVPFEVPAGKGGITAYWVGETQAVTASNETFGQIKLTPHKAAALTKMSIMFARLARPDMEQYQRTRMGQELALLVDKAAFVGSGSVYQPMGIINIPNIPSVALGTNGGFFTLDNIVDLEGKLEDANALFGNLGIAWHPNIKRQLKKTRIPQFAGDTGGAYVMLPMSDARLREIIDYDFRQSTQLPTNLTKGTSTDCTPVIFGNWQDLLIGQWGNMEIALADQAGDAFEKGEIWMRVFQSIDIQVARLESFAVTPDARIK